MFKYKSLSFFVFLFLIVISFFIKSTPARAICNYIESDPGAPSSISAYSVSPSVVTGNSLTSSVTFVSSHRCELNGMIWDGTPSISAGPLGSTGPDWSGAGGHTYSYTFDVSSLANGTYTAYFNVDGFYGAAPQKSTTFIIARTPPPPLTYTVNASAGTSGSITSTTINSGAGTVTSASSAKVDPNSTLGFTVAPDATHTIDKFGVTSSDPNCKTNGPGWSGNVYGTGTINANCTYTFGFTPIPPPPAPSCQAFSGTGCSISNGSGSCNGNITWNVLDPVPTPNITSNTPTANTVITTGNSGTNFPVSVTYPSRNFYCNDGGNTLNTLVLSASCASGTTWDTVSGTCKTTSVINAACNSIHYGCLSGTNPSGNTTGGTNVDNPTQWTWGCNGSGGGTNIPAPGCSETKSTSCAYPPCAVPPTLPTVTTSTPTGVTSNGATGGGNTTSDGGSTVTQSGLVWSTMPNPTTILNGGITYDGWAIGGPWTSSITGLFSSTTYHVRAYATNSVGTSYGSDVIFNTPSSLSMTGSLTPASPSCAIASGGSSCSINFSWSIANPQAIPTAITATGMPNVNVTNTLATPQSGTKSLTVPYNTRTFFLYNNAVKLDQKTVYANCVTGTGWDAVSGTCKVGAATCADPLAVNYPLCTVDAGNNCLNGAIDPTTCTNFGNAGNRINGVCAKTHYSCITGTSGSNVNTPSQWTWTCNGSNGGASPSCTELKKKPKYIEN